MARFDLLCKDSQYIPQDPPKHTQTQTQINEKTYLLSRNYMTKITELWDILFYFSGFNLPRPRIYWVHPNHKQILFLYSTDCHHRDTTWVSSVLHLLLQIQEAIRRYACTVSHTTFTHTRHTGPVWSWDIIENTKINVGIYLESYVVSWWWQSVVLSASFPKIIQILL